MEVIINSFFLNVGIYIYKSIKDLKLIIFLIFLQPHICIHSVHNENSNFKVDPTITNSKLNVLCANARTAICIDSPKFGKVLFVAIGAEGVGSVQLEERVKQEGCKLKKGDKIGKFAYGGSNLLVCFEKGKMQWDADLIKYSKEKLEANVKMGEHIGRKVEREE